MNQAQKLKAKYGEDYFVKMRKKVKRPGFASMDSEKVKQISRMGVEARAKKVTPKES